MWIFLNHYWWTFYIIIVVAIYRNLCFSSICSCVVHFCVEMISAQFLHIFHSVVCLFILYVCLCVSWGIHFLFVLCVVLIWHSFFVCSFVYWLKANHWSVHCFWKGDGGLGWVGREGKGWELSSWKHCQLFDFVEFWWQVSVSHRSLRWVSVYMFIPKVTTASGSIQKDISFVARFNFFSFRKYLIFWSNVSVSIVFLFELGLVISSSWRVCCLNHLYSFMLFLQTM